MASKVNMERLMNKKEAAVERAMDKKERSIEFSNTLNNAVLIWMTLANHPEIEINGALEEIRDIQQVIVGFKGEPEQKPTVSAEEARVMVQDTFPSSTVLPPQPELDTDQKDYTQKDYAIRDPDADATSGQIRMVHGIFGRLGVKDDATKVARAAAKLGLKSLGSLDKLTKGLASALIKMLLADEGGRK